MVPICTELRQMGTPREHHHDLADFGGIGAGIAFVVMPSQLHLATRLAPFELKCQKRITRNRWAPLGTEYFLAVIGSDNLLDKMRRDGIPITVFALPSFHNMTHRSEEHTSELQSRGHLVCRLLLEKKNN